MCVCVCVYIYIYYPSIALHKHTYMCRANIHMKCVPVLMVHPIDKFLFYAYASQSAHKKGLSTTIVSGLALTACFTLAVLFMSQSCAQAFVHILICVTSLSIQIALPSSTYGCMFFLSPSCLSIIAKIFVFFILGHSGVQSCQMACAIFEMVCCVCSLSPSILTLLIHRLPFARTLFMRIFSLKFWKAYDFMLHTALQVQSKRPPQVLSGNCCSSDPICLSWTQGAQMQSECPYCTRC